jgi:hypothetical protein
MQHLEEGTIHAWLDGALSSDDAAHVEDHVQHCDECAAMVADARGLIAGASRIVSALDIVPGGVLPKSTTAVAAPPRSLWRSLHLSPFRAALAASVMVAVGSLFALRGSYERAQYQSKFGHPSGVPSASLPAPMAPSAPVMAPAPAPSPSADHAVVQRTRSEVPRSPDTTFAARAAPAPSTEKVATRVAEARQAVSRDSTPPVVDSLRRVVAESKALAPQPNQQVQRMEQMRRVDSVRALEVVTTTGASGDAGRGGRSAAAARDAMGAAPTPAPILGNSFAATADFVGCYRVVTADSASWPSDLPRQFALGNEMPSLRTVRLVRDDRADTTTAGSWEIARPGAALVSLNGGTRFILTQGPGGTYAQIDNARALRSVMPTRAVPVVRMTCRQ